MQGLSSNEFSGFNSIEMLPFLKDLYDKEKKVEKFPGLLENLFIKSCTSNAKDFKNVILIDTPGLADGHL